MTFYLLQGQICLNSFNLLVGIAGGLTNLSKMPACNVLILGSQKKTLSGFSTAAIMPHTGHIYYSDIVQGTPTVCCLGLQCPWCICTCMHKGF